ncbi:MAG: hypothetical protein CFH06_00666 [Alphaproteobacteria bacterium MarineAlpha3_Bin5]|nr:hypothetical protein [Magnetovibrio sp.]PPR78772.1 MAG: hypothetical protein CFH06_00666 [Alphaproteobacteria bacterium MarineAlpha3_Bin5]|tara:strand:+ start:995 stop:1651 length:657 start_codon:yes stop_codon:yes gene_type:complete
MSGGFQFLDIILLAVIALFLVARLRNALGRRDGHENSGNNNLFQLSDSVEDRKAEEEYIDADNLVTAKEQKQGLQILKKLDPEFSQQQFVEGACTAFEIVLKAYSNHDLEALQTLLSEEVLNQFKSAIESIEGSKQKLVDVLIRIDKAEIVEIYVENKIAFITVEFKSQQINAVRDEKGEAIEGDANREVSVTDFWTFARKTTAKDPNWTLVQTKSPE